MYVAYKRPAPTVIASGSILEDQAGSTTSKQRTTVRQKLK